MKFLVIVAAIVAPALAWSEANSETVPPGIVAWMKPIRTQSITLNDRVLRVAMKVPLVGEDLYKFHVEGLCSMALNTQRYRWDTSKVERIEIVNDIGAQGFALVGANKSCKALGRDPRPGYLATVTRAIRAGRVQD